MGVYLRHRSSFGHETGSHPESAARLTAIEAELSGRDWLGLELVDAPPATREQITRVHTPDHYDGLKAFCEAGGGMIDHDTSAVAASWEAAERAAGAAVHGVELVLADGNHDFAFCAMRPPGHHAERARAMGFCLFNNVAVGAAHAIAELAVERVLIVDWDVHHGNGTEEIFYADPTVLYTSLHQSPLYPGTGAITDIGVAEGEGYNLNLPLAPGSGPDQFLGAIQDVVLPVAAAFEPGLIAISAGYDAHADDPLADCMLDATAYSDMAASLAGFARACGAPILVCLEGGYNVDALAESVAATINGLGAGVAPRTAAAGSADDLRVAHRRHWPVLSGPARR